MDFSHYTGEPVDLAVDLVNTLQMQSDAIETPDQLNEFLDGYRHLWEGVARPLRPTELAAIHKLRADLRDVLDAPDDETAARRVNSILASHGAVPRVSAHNGSPHLHFEPVETNMACWLGAITAMALASIIVEHGVERFGVCCASECRDVYVDASRNRSRRHCSSTCSTREAVSAYRKRQAVEA